MFPGGSLVEEDRVLIPGPEGERERAPGPGLEGEVLLSVQEGDGVGIGVTHWGGEKTGVL